MSTNVCFHVKWRFHFESHWVSQPGFADVVSSQLPSIMCYGRWTLNCEQRQELWRPGVRKE
jgi:hypothetical protein